MHFPIAIQKSTCPICWTHRPARMNSFVKNAERCLERTPANLSHTWKPSTRSEEESKVWLHRQSLDRICAKYVGKVTLSPATCISTFASIKVWFPHSHGNRLNDELEFSTCLIASHGRHQTVRMYKGGLQSEIYYSTRLERSHSVGDLSCYLLNQIAWNVELTLIRFLFLFRLASVIPENGHTNARIAIKHFWRARFTISTDWFIAMNDATDAAHVKSDSIDRMHWKTTNEFTAVKSHTLVAHARKRFGKRAIATSMSVRGTKMGTSRVERLSSNHWRCSLQTNLPCSSTNEILHFSFAVL